MNVVALVVTYNRKVLLLECVNALLNQSTSVSTILIVDNASTDHTYEALSENGFIDNPSVVYEQMKENTGGAGGFSFGMKRAMELKPDYVWIMDDDTIPTKTALEELIKATKITPHETSFWASAVYGVNGEYMNIPELDVRLSESDYPCWYDHLKDGMVRIQNATFVSLLINADAICNCGVPLAFYFIWGDDTEYTLRLTTFYGPAYFVGNSVVTHKRGLAKAISLQNETNSNRIKFFYYKIRNQLINMPTYKNYNTGKLDEMLRSYQRLFLKLLLGIHCKRDKDKAMLVIEQSRIIRRRTMTQMLLMID